MSQFIREKCARYLATGFNSSLILYGPKQGGKTTMMKNTPVFDWVSEHLFKELDDQAKVSVEVFEIWFDGSIEKSSNLV